MPADHQFQQDTGEDFFLGAAALLGEVVLLIVISTIVKSLSSDTSVAVLLLFRYVFCLPLLLAYGLARRGKHVFSIVNLRAQTLRSVFGVLALFSWFLALSKVELAKVTALVQVMPVFITILAPVILREKVGIRRWSAVVFGLLGAIIILKPGTDGWFQIGIAYAFAAAFFAALMFVYLRSLGRSDEPVSSAIWYNFFGSVVLFLYCVATDQSWPDEITVWLVMIGCGFLSSIQQFLISLSHKLASASKLAPFHYFAVPLSVASGMIFFDERIGTAYVIGTAIIIGSAYYIFVREHRLRR